jgi:glycosyltransferase involved in cell wall biosynthesis
MGCGLGVVLRAARLLRERGRRDVRFLLVGDGAIRERLERAAREAGLDEVVFTGRLDKARMPELLAAADVVSCTDPHGAFKTVLPSKIFEASAMRKRSLGVEGFAADLVGSAEAGLCIEPENEAELLAAVERRAADPVLARRLGDAGREHIAARYSYDRLAAEYAERLASLLAARRS